MQHVVKDGASHFNCIFAQVMAMPEKQFLVRAIEILTRNWG